MKYLAFIIVLSSCFSDIFGLKILLIFPPPARSHYTQGNELGKGLARAGHEVTMISSFTDKNPPKNYKEIVLSELLELRNSNETTKGMNLFEMENTPAFLQLFFLDHMGNLMCDCFFEHPKVQALLKSNEHFDVVIVEQFFNDAMKIFAHHFKAHLVVLSLVGSNRWVNNLVGNPEPPSYVPDVLLSYTGDMNIFQRMFNLLFGIISDLHLYLWFYPHQNALMKKYYPNAPELNDLQYNVSLVLLNSHESINHPVPHVPNMVQIGGFHVNPPKELPKDLKEFMDNAKEGVLYFSMGSNLVPSQMPKEKKDAILKVLGSRKEKVLWKWDEPNLENKPDNLMISKWFPQQAILAHPNCKLFITHGGLLSTIETVYLGVPVLAIPIFGDQKLNAARAASLGYGKSLSFSQITEDKFSELIEELVTNPSYGENAKLRSRIMHDRPVKPIDTAVYWIEYIARHNGAPHLRVAGITLPFYKYYMLDIVFAALHVLFVLRFLVKKICGYICKSKKSKSKGSESKSKGSESKSKGSESKSKSMKKRE